MKRSDQQNDLEAYWNEMSESIGEPVVAYNLGQYQGGLDQAAPLWGLLFFTETRIFFRHFAQQNWFASILTNRDTRGSDEVAFELPLEGASLSEPPPQTFLARVFSSKPRIWSLTLRDNSVFHFSVEHSPEKFIAELRPLCRPSS